MKIFNPLTWSKNELIALIVSSFLYGSLGTIIGYIIYVLPRGNSSYSFEYWFSYIEWFYWAISGIIYGYFKFLIEKLVNEKDK